MLSCQRNSLQRYVVAVVFGEPVGQVLFRHEHAARVKVANVQDDQWTAVVVFGNVVDDGGATEAVHDLEADREMVEHRLKQASHCAFLANHYHSAALLIPEVAAIGPGDTAGMLGGIGPG